MPAEPPHGVVLYDKPAGVTSHDVVAERRRTLPRGVKVGHAGTLDPFATGLLLVLVGRATRVQQFLMGLAKTYRAVARLGWTSSTGDRDGALAHTGRVPETIEIPTGELMQRPPAHSAVKVGGERLYRRARRGDPVEGEPRPVTVYRSELLWRDGERAGLEIECSSGTYIRQLVAGLGDAYCEELERTRIGPFRLEDADPDRVVALEEALGFMPARELDQGSADRASHGIAVSAEGNTANAPVRLMHDGSLVAIARPAEDGLLKPFIVLAP
jgi:tRNA pseudouridine55 synthase